MIAAAGSRGWWRQWNDGTRNERDRPWVECRLTWVSGDWDSTPGTRQGAHVLEGLPVIPLSKGAQLLRGARAVWRQTAELPADCRRWPQKPPKAKPAKKVKDKAAADGWWFGAQLDKLGKWIHGCRCDQEETVDEEGLVDVD